MYDPVKQSYSGGPFSIIRHWANRLSSDAVSAIQPGLKTSCNAASLEARCGDIRIHSSGLKVLVSLEKMWIMSGRLKAQALRVAKRMAMRYSVKTRTDGGEAS